MALLTEIETSLLFFGNTTFKYRRGLGKCMEMVDVNGYILSVVDDCYNMQNVQIKEEKPLTNSVNYFRFVMTLCWILMDNEIKQIHINYYSDILLLVDAYFSYCKICYGLLN